MRVLAVQLFQGKDSEAFELFSKAHELEPLQLAPISGILSVYFNAKDFAKMDEVTAGYLTPENFKKLEGTDKEKLSFFRLLIFAELQQNKTSEAEKHLCKLQKINLAERDPELDTILAKIPAEQCAKYE